MDEIRSFILSVAAGVVAEYIYKWLGGKWLGGWFKAGKH